MARHPRQHRSTRLGLVLALTIGLGAAGLLAASPPASAAVSVDVNAPDGTVGVAETVSATVTSTLIGTPAGIMTFVAGGQSIGTRAVGGALGSTAQLSWTPAAAGALTVQATFKADDGQSAADSATAQIAKVDTASSMVSPGSAAASAKVTLTATVLSRKGQYVPTGSVTFLLSDNSVIGRATLDAAGRATVTYTVPSASGTVRVLAAYGGDLNANPSKTAVDSIKVTAQGSTVTLVVPQTNYVNTAVVMVALISPTTATGTVEFSVNGKFLGSSKVDKGASSLTWVPNALGTFTLSAKYSGGNGVSGGTASNSVQVVQQLKVDQITVVQTGSTGPWVPSTVTTLANGSSVALTATAASGQPVQLSVVGPCSLNGSTLQVNGVGGACVLTASTKGGSGYAPSTQKYTVQTAVGAQTARLAAPASGAYERGLRLKLSRLTTVTNVNQPVRWRVTRGASHCKVVVNGAFYKLKLISRGPCTVKAYAPPVSNQWAAFTSIRKYRVV